METLEDELYKESLAYYEDIKEQFIAAQMGIQDNIEKWYRRLADNNGISYAAARQFLKKEELEEFKWSLDQYIQKGRENAISEKWVKELENASAKYHISYYEAMKVHIQQHAELLFTEFETGMADFLKRVFEDQFYKTAFEVAKGTGVGVSLVALDVRKIDTVIKTPWAQDGRVFSDRIWQNKEKLVRELHTELVQNIIRGEAPQKAINSLAKKMNVSKAQAGTLVMTESAAASAQARKKCFSELDVDRYQFDAALDGRTCETCGSMDGKVFKMSEYEIGITANPLHPNCRCCTVPYFAEWYGLDRKRVARDPLTGKEYKVPADMTYQEWMDKYHDGGILEETTDKWSREAKEELLMDEKALSVRKKETAVVYGPDGKFLFQKRGGENDIRFSVADYQKLKGTVITHNHPSGGSFSNRDILFLKTSKAAELRVITERCIYYMRRPLKWSPNIDSIAKIKVEREKIRIGVRKKYQELFLSGKISKAERYQLSSEEEIRIFAERFGIEYGKEPFGD